MSISDNGNVLAVGAPNYSTNNQFIGYINLYKNVNNNWVLFGEQIQGVNAFDLVGYRMDLTPDGNYLGVGIPYDDTNATNSGKVIIYDLTSALSEKQLNTQQFTIYPNPTKTHFTIQLENTTELKNVTIYNNLGQQVLTSKKSIINSSNLASGLFVIEIETNKGKASKKLIIE